LYKITSKAIQSDDDAAPVIAALDSIRDKGITLMLETHMGHTKNNSGSRDVRPRGSAALLGWPEFGAGLARVKNEASEGMPVPGLADLIHWRGQRDHRPWPDQWVHGATWPWEPL
jgi:replicative DNA helicase